MRPEKQEIRQQLRELRSLVMEWDPFGLVAEGAPVHEYECMVGPLLRHLHEKEGNSQIASFLSAELADHFGVPDIDATAFAARAVDWYKRGRQATPAVG